MGDNFTLDASQFKVMLNDTIRDWINVEQINNLRVDDIDMDYGLSINDSPWKPFVSENNIFTNKAYGETLDETIERIVKEEVNKAMGRNTQTVARIYGIEKYHLKHR